MNLFEQLEQIGQQIEALCPYDNHNELLTLNALKAKTLKRIDENFNL